MATFLTICFLIGIFCFSMWRKVASVARQNAPDVFVEERNGGSPFFEEESPFEPEFETPFSYETEYEEQQRSSRKTTNRSKEKVARPTTPVNDVRDGNGTTDVLPNADFDLRQAVIAQTILHNDYLPNRY